MNHLNPNAVWMFFFQSVLGWAFSIVFVGFLLLGILTDNVDIDLFFTRSLFVSIIVFAIVGVIVAFVWSKLSYHFYKYELVESGFRKESGVIWKRYVTIPYSRIQNVDIYRGVLARILGLSDLQIQTAGASATVGRYGASGMGAEGRLPGLSKADAERLRDELIERARKNSGSGV